MSQPASTSGSAVVSTTGGQVRGYAYKGVSIFKGIPYGAPTSGARRFLPPAPAAPWSGIRSTVDYSDTAPQAPRRPVGGAPGGRRGGGGEASLALNVWPPAADDGRRPVMVWLHGGGFEAGSGSSMLYDGTNLVRRGGVVAGA